MAILSASINLAKSQNDYSTVHPSPNIGWNLADIMQDNDLYTGTARIDLPLYELQVGKFKLPIRLTYNTKSLPMDQLPSWVGLGWNLDMDGQVSRVVNGKPDELRETKSATSIFSTIYEDGSSSSQTVTAQTYSDNDFAYISNYGKLNDPNWATNGYLFGTLNNIPVIETSIGVHQTTSFLSYPPSITTQPLGSVDYTRNYDFEPDEFDFNIGMVSGKFYMDHNGKWICQSNNGNFQVTPLIATNIPKTGVSIPRLIYGFNVVAPDGTKYFFGGTSNNYLQGVEFWRGPSSGGGGNVFQFFGNSYLGVCPNAWKIRQIVTPENQTIDFTYQSGGLQLCYSDAPFGSGDNSSLFISLPGYTQQSLAEPVYLTGITCSNGLNVAVQSQNSNQLGTDINIFNPVPLVAATYSTFTNYADIIYGNNNTNSLPKLTSLKIYDNSTLVKNFDFEYTDNIAERLKLNSVSDQSLSDPSISKKYSFTYNTSQGTLPKYGSGLVDHFGYYNNKRFFPNNTQFQYIIGKTDFEAQYFSSREPDFTYSTCETLDKMYLPTGGYRQFVYEPNDYSSSITRWPFGVSVFGGNHTTGGIRVSKFVDYTDGGVATETSFIYKQDIAGTLSSGVLAIPTPQYTTDNGKVNGGYDFSTRSFIPFDRAQSHIGYSTVFEKRDDGSYIKHTFENYDNGGNDGTPLYENPSPAFTDFQPYTKNSFKRGILRETAGFDNNGNAVYDKTYKYQEDYDDYSRYIRSVRLKHGDPSTGAGFRVSAYPQYYFPNQKRYSKEIVNTYSAAPAVSNSLVTESNYTFDSYNNLISVNTTDSKTFTLENQYKHPYDFPADPVLQSMVTANILSPVVQKTTIRNGTQTFLDKTNFTQLNNGAFVPLNKQVQVANNAIETRQLFNQYDSYGNLTESQKLNGPKEVTLWGYKGKYPVAKVNGSDYFSVINSGLINPAVLDAPTDNQTLRAELAKLRTGLPSAMVNSFTYAPYIGISSETDPSGHTIYYNYDGLGRLSNVMDQDKNVTKRFSYNFSGQPDNTFPQIAIYGTNTSSTPITINITGPTINTNYSIYPGYNGTPLGTVPYGVGYNIALTSAYGPLSGQLTINGVPQTGLTATNLTITASLTVGITNATTPVNPGPCEIVPSSGFSFPTYNLYSSGTSVSVGYMVFYSSVAISQGNSYKIGSISANGRPSSIQSFSGSSNGRTWTITVYPSGDMYAQMSYGSAPTNPNETISISPNTSYNL